jgi:hypothetical protein
MAAKTKGEVTILLYFIAFNQQDEMDNKKVEMMLNEAGGEMQAGRKERKGGKGKDQEKKEEEKKEEEKKAEEKKAEEKKKKEKNEKGRGKKEPSGADEVSEKGDNTLSDHSVEEV